MCLAGLYHAVPVYDVELIRTRFASRGSAEEHCSLLINSCQREATTWRRQVSMGSGGRPHTWEEGGRGREGEEGWRGRRDGGGGGRERGGREGGGGREGKRREGGVEGRGGREGGREVEGGREGGVEGWRGRGGEGIYIHVGPDTIQQV